MYGTTMRLQELWETKKVIDGLSTVLPCRSKRNSAVKLGRICRPVCCPFKKCCYWEPWSAQKGWFDVTLKLTMRSTGLAWQAATRQTVCHVESFCSQSITSFHRPKSRYHCLQHRIKTMCLLYFRKDHNSKISSSCKFRKRGECSFMVSLPFIIQFPLSNKVKCVTSFMNYDNGCDCCHSCSYLRIWLDRNGIFNAASRTMLPSTRSGNSRKSAKISSNPCCKMFDWFVDKSASMTRYVIFQPSCRKQSHTRVTNSKGKELVNWVKSHCVANIVMCKCSLSKCRASLGKNWWISFSAT